jgi:hypothetical protein
MIGAMEDLDSWPLYLRRNFEHRAVEQCPFPYSAWSFQEHDDHSLTETILTELYKSSEVDASLIQVYVVSGHVVLEGEVSSEREKEKTLRIVQGIEGVWRIDNKLRLTFLKEQGWNLGDLPR